MKGKGNPQYECIIVFMKAARHGMARREVWRPQRGILERTVVTGLVHREYESCRITESAQLETLH